MLAFTSSSRAQSFDYYLLTGVATCSSTLSTTDNIRSVIPGQEEHVLGTYSYGYAHDLLDEVDAPGDVFSSATERVIVCPRYNLDAYYIDATMSGGGDGGYIVSYHVHMKRENSGENIIEEEDSAGGDAGCFEIDGELSGNVAGVWQGGYYYGMDIYALGATNSAFCDSDGTAYARLQFTVNLSSSPTPTPSATPTQTPTQTPTPENTPVDPCPDGYIYQDGQCVDQACENVTCPEGNICIGGMCYDEDDDMGRLLDEYECVNFDPNLNDIATYWETNAPPGDFGYPVGMLNLMAGEYIWQENLSLNGGPFRFIIRAKTCIYVAHTYPLWQHEWYIENDCQWRQWEVIKSFSSPTDPHLGIIVDNAFPIESNTGLSVEYICVYPYLISTATPTITPLPTPNATPTPVPNNCSNTDPSFESPELWTAQNGAYYNPSDDSYTLPPNSSVYGQTFSLSNGDYRIEVGGQSLQNGNTVILTWGDYLNESFSMIPSQNVYYANFNIYGPGGIGSVTVRSGYSNPGSLSVGYVCITRLGASSTPTPNPTITPAPTQTPGGSTATPIPSTSTPAPTPGSGGQGYCLNTDPNLDSTIWQVSGGTLSGGVADIAPGGSLFGTVPSDMSKSYYVHVVGKSTPSVQSIANWRSSRIPFSIPDGSYAQVTIPFPAETEGQQLAPLPQAKRQSTTFVSPLSLQELYFVSPLQPPDRLLVASGDILVIENPASNGANIQIESVCVTENTAGDGGDTDRDLYDLDIFHPVCESDYVIQAAYDDTLFQAMRVGPGEMAGMPVHAIIPGTVLQYGDWLSFVFGGNVYDHCAMIDHSALLNVPLQTIYCGIADYRIPASGIVKGGSLLGYAGIESQDDLLTIAVQVNNEWVDPDTIFEIYSDCYPYMMVFEPLGTCDSDDGNELIVPRYNAKFPGWRVAIAALPHYFPWLVRTLYDYIGYPILCAMVTLFNMVIGIIVDGANMLIGSITPVFIFLYRLSRLFEYVLEKIKALITGVFLIIKGMDDIQACFKDILRYFTEAIAASGSATADLENMYADNTVLFGVVAVSQLLLNSRVASYILWPLTIIFIGYSAWRILPWAYKQLRNAIGLGD